MTVIEIRPFRNGWQVYQGICDSRPHDQQPASGESPRVYSKYFALHEYSLSETRVLAHLREPTNIVRLTGLSGYKKPTKALFGKSCDLRQRQAM